MSVQLNHTIVWCRDKWRSAEFLAQMLGRQPPFTFGPFQVVELDNGVSLDFGEKPEAVTPQHYAFLISEPEFDAVLSRLEQRHAVYWADPSRKRSREINHNDGGRGLYFEDPDKHLLEVMTRPYGDVGAAKRQG